VTEIGGDVEPGFEGVADAFRSNFVEHGDVGAATAVYVGGKKVVDLWGGTADVATGRPYDEDTLQLVFSTTKGATAACLNLLAQRGDLDIDAPVATYWPEFKAAGKGEIPVRWLLCHKAGLPYVDGEMSFEDALAWDPVIRALEAQAPIWEPGTAHGYHATTYGWLCGEVVRRITGKSLGTFFAEEVAGPLGLDFWIGLPEAAEPRVAAIIPAPVPGDPRVRTFLERELDPSTLLGRVITGPSRLFGYDEMWNRRALHAAEMPSSNGIGTARAVARMYAAIAHEVDGVRLRAGEPHASVNEVGAEHAPLVREPALTREHLVVLARGNVGRDHAGVDVDRVERLSRAVHRQNRERADGQQPAPGRGHRSPGMQWTFVN